MQGMSLPSSSVSLYLKASNTRLLVPYANQSPSTANNFRLSAAPSRQTPQTPSTPVGFDVNGVRSQLFNHTAICTTSYSIYRASGR